MDDKQLQGVAKRPLRPRYAAQKIGILVICLGFCFILSPSQAAAANVEEQNKAVAWSAFLEYLNHKDFKSFEGITLRILSNTTTTARQKTWRKKWRMPRGSSSPLLT